MNQPSGTTVEETYEISLSYICPVTHRTKKKRFPYKGEVSEAGAKRFREAMNNTEQTKVKPKDFTNVVILSRTGKPLIEYRPQYGE